MFLGMAAFVSPLTRPNFGTQDRQRVKENESPRQSGFTLGPVAAELSMKYFPGPDQDAVLNALWSPRGERIAAIIGAVPDVFIWSVKDQRLIGRVPREISSLINKALAFSPDGCTLVVSAIDRNLRAPEYAALLIDSNAAKVTGHISPPRRPPTNWALEAAAADPKGRWLALFFPELEEGSAGEIHLYDPVTWAPVQALNLGRRKAGWGPGTTEEPIFLYPWPERTMAVHPEGTLIALARQYTGANRYYASAQSNDDTTTIQQWDTSTASLRLEFNVTQPKINFVGPAIFSTAYSRDGQEIVTGFGNTLGKRLLVWEASTGKYLREIPVEFPRFQAWGAKTLAISPDGAAVAASFSDNRLMVFDFASGETIAQLNLESPCLGLGFSPDGTSIAYSEGSTIVIRTINVL